MDLLQACRHRRARVAAGIHDVLAVVVLGLVEQRLDAWLREAPRAGVERLLLRPDNCLCIGVHVQVFLELLPGEGVQLLEAGECDVVNLVVGTILVQASPDLPGAQDDAVNPLGRLDAARLVLRVGDDPLEARVLAGKILNIGTSEGMAEQRL